MNGNRRISAGWAIASTVLAITAWTLVYDQLAAINQEFYQTGYRDGQASQDAYLDGFYYGLELRNEIIDLIYQLEKVENLEPGTIAVIKQELEELNRQISQAAEKTERLALPQLIVPPGTIGI